MQDIVNCLWFDGRGLEAAMYYTRLFPNSRILGQSSGPEGGEPMTVNFELNGRSFVALNGGPAYVFNEAVSFQIVCDSQEEIDRYWDALTAGGAEGKCGWLTDRFGVSWQVVPHRLSELLGGGDPEVARRVVEAFMPMRKFDLAVLEAAAAG
jgi:predicted 3-demethylubiquinone-9 3-methyltransferase (glyoxalase superfamily)